MEEKTIKNSIDLSSFKSVEPHIHMRLLSSEHARETLSKLARHPICADIWMTYYVETDDILQNSIVGITYKMLEQWKVTVNEIARAAALNDAKGDYRPVIKPLSQVLLSMCPCDDDDLPPWEEDPDETKMLVVSNRRSYNGASAILSTTAYNAIKDAFPSGAYLLPSSRHEFLAVSNEINPDNLHKMINEINRSSVVRPEDILSDHLFTYSAPGSIAKVI